jgi:TolC family type I secretion outer membrane protein
LAGTAALAIAPARAQTLLDALAGAYATNPQIRGARAQLEATAEGAPQALAGWRPTVTMTTNAGPERIDYITKTSAGDIVGTENMHQKLYQVAVTQPLYSGGQTIAKTGQADHLFAAQQWSLMSTEQNIMLAVASDYADVARDEAIVEVNEKNVKFLAHELARTRERVRVGEVTATDVAQSEGYYAAAGASLKQALATLAASRANYQRDVGQPPAHLRSPSLSLALPKTRDDAVNETMDDNPDILSAKESTLAARFNVDAIRSQLLPQVSAVAGMEKTRDLNVEGQDLTAKTVMLQMTMPLYEAGSVYSETRQAMRTVAVQRSQIDTARRQAVDNVSAAWDQYAELQGVVKSLKEAVQADAKTLEGMIAENTVGVRTVFDVLNAQSTLFNAQVSLATAQASEFTARLGIAQGIGKLTAADLKLPVAPYDPNAYMNAVRDKWIGFYPATDEDAAALQGPAASTEAK